MNQKNKSGGTAVEVKKILACVFLAYVILVFLFYWLAGDQLHIRQSRGNITMAAPEMGVAELKKGVVVEQTFSAKIMRLRSVSVLWGTYYRPNDGIVYMELYNKQSGSIIMKQSFDASSITEGGQTTMELETPAESIWEVPLLLRIYADSAPGCAVAPMMSSSNQAEGFSLTLNEVPVDGELCFSVSGEDYIWTGLHYWEIAAGFGLILLLSIALVWIRWRKGKRSYVVDALIAVRRYQFLIKQLVARDFKAKYKRSVLGVFWSFLNPLLTMAVQYVVFSNLFRFDLPHYQVYLITGIVIFNAFTESTTMALGSIIGNAGLITKVYVPKYIYPLTRVLSSLVNLLLSLIPLMLVVAFSGIDFTKAFLLLPFVLICLTVFCLGIGMLLAAGMVFFRDIQFLWGVFSMIWMYLTPVFYPVSILPENVAEVLKINPLYYYITFTRTCIMDGISPEPRMYAQCVLFSLGMLLVGALVFRKVQDRFVLYL